MSGIIKPIILNETGEDLVKAMNHNTATMLAMNTSSYNPDGTLLEVQDAREIGGVKHASLGEAVRSLAENINLGIAALNAAIGDANISVLGDDVTHAIINLNDSLENKAGYINSVNKFTPAKIILPQKTVNYSNGEGVLDVSQMGITPISMISTNVIGSANTCSAFGNIPDSKTLRSVLNNTQYSGNLTTVFTVLCSIYE